MTRLWEIAEIPPASVELHSTPSLILRGLEVFFPSFLARMFAEQKISRSLNMKVK